jgi:hypothetical protein
MDLLQRIPVRDQVFQVRSEYVAFTEYRREDYGDEAPVPGAFFNDHRR